ncbi:MAG: helix-turn-helix domain-containing protein [Bdellovibrionaceae bacterium]|nr:helix-turn-helix domain-containing protein [Pseudobdellovibrionaceae bacterium]
MASRTKIKGLSAFLRDKRIELNMTQLQASRALGHSSPQYISNFERGLCEPSLETAMKLCELYGIPRKQLYEIMVELYQQEMSDKIFKKTGRRA